MLEVIERLRDEAIFWFYVFAILASPFVVAKVALVCTSEEGLWTAYPHSGFCPDAPEAIDH